MRHSVDLPSITSTTTTAVLIIVTSKFNSELTVRDEVDVISPCTEPAPGQRDIACQRPRHCCCPVAACLLTDRSEACEQTMPEQ